MSRAAGHVLLIWLVSTLTLGLLALVMPGFRPGGEAGRGPIGSLLAAGSAAAVFGVLSAVVWPRLVRAMLLIPSMVLASLVFLLNGGLVLLALRLAPRDYGTLDLPAAVMVAATLSTVVSATHGALAARDDEAYRRRLARMAGRQVRRRRPGQAGPRPGVVFLQLDGLGHDVLRIALRTGHLPTVAGWLGRGSHRVVPWRTDWSSQTGASQLGILHGSNQDVPAFRWFEKSTGRIMQCSRPATVAELERRVRDTGRPGLLARDGASRGNLFTGGAIHSALVLSVSGRPGRRDRTGYFAYFSDPASATRTVFSFVAEVVRELVASARQRWRDERPRVRRGGLYPLVRAFATVVERDVVVAAVMGDMLAGRAVVFADLVGYDEVAHHSGVKHPETMDVLRRLDRRVAMIADVMRYAPRQYELVLLSDHGQSAGEPFTARYGLSLAELVRAGTGCRAPLPYEDPTEDTGRGAEVRARLARPGTSVPARPPVAATEPVVLASGNLGMVWFPHVPDRMTAQEIERHSPGLLRTLSEHPGIGFLLVRDADRGPLVIGPKGTHELAGGVVDGVDPLADFGPGAAEAVLRTDSFENCADIMINSAVDPETGQVHSFEEQIGSHGGLGGGQGTAFVLYPAKLPPPEEPLVGAESVHRLFAGWIEHLQPTAPPATEDPAPTPATEDPAPTADRTTAR
ncbi:MAG TPA: phage holin family protein [Pseudonocardiaceae bacterium]